MLKEKINADFITAMKNKEQVKKNLLSVIRGEIQTMEKNMGGNTVILDDDITNILNKIAKSLRESIKISPTDELNEELTIVESYLPKQMTQEEITIIVKQLIEENDLNIAEVMRHFGNLPADRKEVSSIYHSLKK
jgi:uncharacterized protein YqeY